MTLSPISQQDSRKLIEGLLSAIANQKFLHELHPWEREEVQTTIDRIFNEGMNFLSRLKDSQDVLCRVEGVGYVVRLCFGTEEVIALGVRLGAIEGTRITFWIKSDPGMDEYSVSFVIGESTIKDVIDSFSSCNVEASVQKSTYRCINCGNFKD